MLGRFWPGFGKPHSQLWLVHRSWGQSKMLPEHRLLPLPLTFWWETLSSRLSLGKKGHTSFFINRVPYGQNRDTFDSERRYWQ